MWGEKGTNPLNQGKNLYKNLPPSNPMLVLGIESSCDETGLALYDTQRGLLAHALYSQVAMHEEYGGVVPELASRDHIRRAIPLLEQVLADSGCARGEIDAIAYTQGPGLAGALLVGARSWRARWRMR